MIAIGRTSKLLLAACVLTTFLALIPASAEACSESNRHRASKVPSTNGRPPILIGDSTSILAAGKLARLGIDADAHGCRQFSEGLAMISRRRNARSLPHVVILALGANGPIQNSQITRALRIVGPDRVLALVTPPKAGASAAAMRRAARRKPNRVLLVDWARISSHHGNWFDGDGLHPGHTGASAFARIVKQTVAPYAFANVKKLRLPKTSKRSEFCGKIHFGGKRLRVYVVRGDERSTCTGALAVAKRPLMRRSSGWRFYDLRAAKAGPWEWARLNPKRKTLIAVTR